MSSVNIKGEAGVRGEKKEEKKKSEKPEPI